MYNKVQGEQVISEFDGEGLRNIEIREETHCMDRS